MPRLIQTPSTNELNRRMSDGHLLRKGHKLESVQVSDSDGLIWHTVKLCCGETVETVETWTTPTL